MTPRLVRLSFATGISVESVKADCLLLKNVTDGLFGPEEAVNRVSGGRLAELGQRLGTAPGAASALVGLAGVSSRAVILVGVGPSGGITYELVGAVCEKGTELAVGLDLEVRTIATTIHAVGFGLARNEVFKAELFGFKRALERAGPKSERVQEIVFVTGESYLPLYDAILQALASASDAAFGVDQGAYFLKIGTASQAEAQFEKRIKDARYVFVAMPFKREFENVFDFGMRLPIERCGLLPVRLDREAYTGSISLEIKKRIRDSSLVIADVTDSNPNVLYELGYADGLQIPTIVVSQRKEGVELPFDIRDINTLFYESELLRDLNRQLIMRIRQALQT